jgi:uncharacterized protein (TIGR02246 family)
MNRTSGNPATAGTLSTADRLEILQLIADHTRYEDSGQFEAWASLFTEDGSFIRRSGEPIVGRDALAAYSKKRLENPAVRTQIHWVGNVTIHPTEEGAYSESYSMLIGNTPDGYKILKLAGKNDVIRRENSRWRFHSRRVTPLAE